MWRLAHSGMQTDDKHAGFQKKWHGPITPYSHISELLFKAMRKKNMYPLPTKNMPSSSEASTVDLATPEKYMVLQRFLLLFMPFMRRCLQRPEEGFRPPTDSTLGCYDPSTKSVEI